jgi:transcriptional regulator with XRE-family HTH domain
MSTDDGTTRRIGKRLKGLRLEKGLTQADLAEKAKLNTNYYAKIERGEVKPAPEAYEKIAKALKVTAADIFPF